MIRIIYTMGLVFTLGLVAMVTTPHARLVAAEDEPQTRPGIDVILVDNPRPNPRYIAPPSGVLEGTPRRADALPINIVFNPTFDPANPPANAGDLCAPVFEGDPDPNNPTMLLQPWPPDAMTAMNTAALIWSTLLNGRQRVDVNACWYSTLDPPSPNGPSTLGSARAVAWDKDFFNAPVGDTWYPVALANQLANSDWDPGRPEIKAQFSAAFDWYFGVDGLVPDKPADPSDPDSLRSDFLSVALHELGHGLGFSGSAEVDNGLDPDECDGRNGYGCVSNPPTAYDRFAYFGSKSILDFTDPQELGTALIVNQWFFNGPNTKAANGSAPARLFAPITWSSGSSYSHLDENTFNPTTSALMTPQLGRREVIHHPGPVGLGVLADIGWSVNSRSFVYVDGSHTGDETGAKFEPFNTVREGVAAVDRGGTVWITARTYDEKFTISRPMWLKTTGGTVTIGE